MGYSQKGPELGSLSSTSSAPIPRTSCVQQRIPLETPLYPFSKIPKEIGQFDVPEATADARSDPSPHSSDFRSLALTLCQALC